MAGWTWAAVAGSFAAMSAIVAKMSSPELSLAMRVSGYGGVVLLNILMWSCYTKSLKVLTSLQATVASFASNFLLTGLGGWFFFREDLHFQWFAGAFLILLGILSLSKASTEDQEVSVKPKQN